MLAALALAGGQAFAQSYPSKPVRIIVPFVAGGALDTLARLLGSKLSEQIGQPVVVENRAGAGGNAGADAVAKAAADGYTILLTTNGLAISAALYRSLPFDPAKDLVPVTQLVESSLVLVAGPKLPAKSTQELIALAKAKPGSLNYGMTGIGNPLHLSMEMLKSTAGLDIQAVPYRGDAPLLTALVAGEVELAVVPLTTARQHIESGALRALGVTSAKRSAAMPDIPTIAEGGVPGYDSPSWHALFVPSGTPPDAIALIQRESAKALRAPDVVTRLRSFGSDPVASTPEEAHATFKAALAKYARVAKEANIPMQD
jgi:tripartite-type tricarboxylate transporter receptor subunit TctC